MRFPNMGLHNHGCVKAESRMQRNQHVRFGGGRLETQVELCAGRLPYFLLFGDNKTALWRYRQAIIQRLERYRLTIHSSTAFPRPTAGGIPFLGFVIFPEYRRLKRRKGIAYQRKLKYLLRHAPQEKIKASVQGWINHLRYGDTFGLRKAVLS